jgi:cell division protein FtsB
VTPAVFGEFVQAINGHEIEITETNATELLALSSEFEFSALSAKIAAFLNSPAVRLTALASVISAQADKITSLSSRVQQLEADVLSLRDEVALAAVARAESATKRELATEADLLRADVAALRRWAMPWLDSQILTTLPSIFDEFRGRTFRLLWRGSRDGFSRAEFHRRCDAHSPTLTVIRAAEGGVFGGFTPIAWESIVWNRKDGYEHNGLRADASLTSFLFSLQNPHNTRPMRFPLRANRQIQAVLFLESRGPAFGYGLPDLVVGLDGDTPCHSKGFGTTYDFDRNLAPTIDPKLFLTGKEYFTLAEIEVFEIQP